MADQVRNKAKKLHQCNSHVTLQDYTSLLNGKIAPRSVSKMLPRPKLATSATAPLAKIWPVGLGVNDFVTVVRAEGAVSLALALALTSTACLKVHDWYDILDKSQVVWFATSGSSLVPYVTSH